MNFSTSELTWSSEIKCKPSLQNLCTKTNAYVYMHASVRVFSNKRCEEESISSWISQQVNLPEIQRSSVNHHCNIFAPKQTHMDICRQVHAIVRVETKGAKKEHQCIYLSTSKLTLSSEIKCNPSCALTLHRNKKKSRNGIACHMIKALSLDC